MPHTITDDPYWAQAKIYKAPEHREDIGYVYGIFDNTHILFVEVPLSEMGNIEAQYILRFLPRLNKSFPSSDRIKTLDDYQSVDIRFYRNRVQVMRILRHPGVHGDMGYFEVADLQKVSLMIDGEVSE